MNEMKLKRKDPYNQLSVDETKVARLREHILEKIAYDDERLGELDEEE